MRFMYRTALLIGVTLLASQAAQATTLLQGYTDLASWQAAVAQLGLDTFEGVVGSNGSSGTTYNTVGGYTDALGIDFVGAFSSLAGSDVLQVIGAAYAPSPWWDFGTGATLASGQTTNSGILQPQIVAKLPANITAIALDVMTYGNIVPVTLTASDGTTLTVSTAARQQTFYGFTFNAPVSTLTISVPSENGGYVLLDNFRIGTADVAAPEPATMLLLGLGLVFVAFLRKRRHA
jgi:PEP-CTERM motif